MNSIIISGIVASAVQVRESGTGKPVSNFELSEKNNFHTRHNIACWDGMVKYSEGLEIGDPVIVRGKLQYSKSQSGKTYANIVVDYIEKLIEEEFIESEEPQVVKKGQY